MDAARRVSDRGWTAAGLDAIDDVRLAYEDIDINFEGFSAIDMAVKETLSEVSGLSARDFREYFLALSFKMYNEDRDNELIEYSERFRLVNYERSSAKLRDIRNYSRLLRS